jgi:hypothetical protein
VARLAKLFFMTGNGNALSDDGTHRRSDCFARRTEASLMVARILCVSACLLGAALGSCLPVASKESQDGSTEVSATVANDDQSPDVPLQIAISQFPGGYQGRWAASGADCIEDGDGKANLISLQGKLLKIDQSIGTMTAGNRLTSKTMKAEFEFAEDGKKWNRDVAFKLSEDRSGLSVVDSGDGKQRRYVRCPTLMAG